MASDKGLDRSIRKVEKTSLQKFKNQNRVVKKFGSSGLKVYRAIRKTGISVKELVEKTGIEQAKLAEILAFLEEKGMIEPGEGEGAPEVEEEAGIAAPEGPVEEEPAKKGRAIEEAVPEEEKPEEELPKKKRAIEEEIAPEEEEKPRKKKKEEIEPLEEEGEKAIAPEGEIVPEEEELPKEEEEAAKEKPPAEEKEEEEEKPAEEEEKEVIPLEMEEEKAPKEEEEEKPAEEEAPPEELEPHEEEPPPGEEEPPEEEEAFLTPGEKKIKDKYGQQGLDVYNLIDGQRTAEEIMKQTGVTEAKLIEMLDFMEKEGIIKLEHPGGKKPAAPPPRAPSAREEGGFAPMIEGSVGGGEAPAVQPSEGPEFVLDIPAKTGGNMIKEIQMKAALMIRFRQPGVKVMELIDGNRDVVKLAIDAGVPLYTVYDVLVVLKREGLVSFKAAVRDEIRRRYGEDGYSVYKRYGREGVMLYQLIGKDMDLRQMAEKTSKDNKRVVEIFMFIHKLLGIDLPIDEEVLLERLSAPAPGKK